MSDKDKINKLYWDTYNEYTIGRGDPIKGHELAMEVIENAIYNQALEDAAACCEEMAGEYSRDFYRDKAAAADDCAFAIESLKRN